MWSWLLLLIVVMMAPPVWGQTGHEEAICLTSAVFFCENWEDRPVGWPASTQLPAQFKNSGWLIPLATGGTVVTSEHIDGTKSVQLTTPANQASGGTMESLGAFQRAEVYWRMYEKFAPNYIWSPIGTKNWEATNQIDSGSNGFFNKTSNTAGGIPYIVLFNSTAPVGGTILSCGATCRQFLPNSGGAFNFTPGQWYCLELHLKYNSPQTLEAWADGVLRWSYPNTSIANINELTNGLFMVTYWNCGGPNGTDCHGPQAPDFIDYTHPDLFRYFDNIILSSARIGCIGTPVQTPGTPSNLQVTMAWLGRLWAWLAVRPAYAGPVGR